MDAVGLLAAARAAGLRVAAVREQLEIRGPSRATAVAEALLARKVDVLAALTVCPDERPAQPTLPPDVWSTEAARELIAHYLHCVGWAWAAIPVADRTPALIALWVHLLASFALIKAARQQHNMPALRTALAAWEQQAAPLFAAYRTARAQQQEVAA